jgi:hypothetical protein
MVMIAFVGLATFDKPGTGALTGSPAHQGFSPHSSRGLSKSTVMPLSGAEKGSLLLLLLCGWLSSACSSYPPRSNNLQVRLRKKRRKCSLGNPMSLIGHPD